MAIMLSQLTAKFSAHLSAVLGTEFFESWPDFLENASDIGSSIDQSPNSSDMLKERVRVCIGSENVRLWIRQILESVDLLRFCWECQSRMLFIDGFSLV